MTDDPGVAALKRLIEQSRRAVCFTGAGISTESGIPDFRSPGGIWTRQKPIEFADYVASEEIRREAWRRKFSADDTLRDARPNRGHRAVAALIASGKSEAVITQNIDGLHQESGIAAERVIELHGNATYAHCLECWTRYELAELEIAFRRDEVPPRCTRCSGVIKTAT